MTRLWVTCVGLSALLGASAAEACGVCVEDKVAATYDHAVIRQAIDKRQQVVFVAVDGNVRVEDVRRDVARASVPGVVAGTLRTTAAPAAYSFARGAPDAPARAVAAFRKAVRDPHARLTLLRVVRDGKIIVPRSPD